MISKLLCLVLTFSSILHGSNTLRSQVDTSIRGNSFGLENFLFQTYKDVETNEPIRNVKPKRVRPTPHYRTPLIDRGQTFGLENLAPQVYDSARLKPNPAKTQFQYPQQTINEPVLELNKLRGTKRKEQTSEVIKVPETPQPETTTEEITIERIRKRVTMRRRRKKPSNSTQSSETAEENGNAIFKPIRIPITSQVQTTTVKTKLNITETTQRIRPVSVKPIKTTSQPEVSTTEETTEEEIKTEKEKSVTEVSTVLTTKETPTTENPSTINLKTFLKQQTETLSLSELLQTQNLSLADLLRNSKDASAILKARQSLISSTTSTSVGYRRKTFNRPEVHKEVSETEPPKKLEIEEISSPRPSFNRFQPKIPRIKTGEKINKKPEEISAKEVENDQEEILRSTKRAPVSSYPSLQGFDPQSRLNELRSKLKNFQRKTIQPEVTSPIPVKIGEEQVLVSSTESLLKDTEEPSYKKNRFSFKSTNNPELSLILPTKLKAEASERRPDRITNWTNRLPSLKRFGLDKVKQSENLIVKPLKISLPHDEEDSSSQNSEENNFKEEEPKTTQASIKEVKVFSEEVPKPEAKDELIELLKSGQNADRLQRILLSRNMTIQELLDNREKPSVQMNISELFSKNLSEIELVSSSTQLPIIFDSLPDFEIESNNYRTPEILGYDEPYAEESVPNIATVELIPSREPKHFDLPVSENHGKADFNFEPDDLKADTSHVENSALWKLSEKAIYYGSSYGYGVTEVQALTEKSVNSQESIQTENDAVILETLRRKPETNRKFKLDLSDFTQEVTPLPEDIEKSYIPPAVKSAIIASGVVMGIALFVFIAIFAACGWKQRQIRLKGSSSILGNTLTRSIDKSNRANTLSPVSFKDTNSYKKTIDFDDESSESGSSHTSSYLWSTLKNTFTSRTTLKSRLEKEEKMREDRMTLRRNESRGKIEGRTDNRPDSYLNQNERFVIKKIDRDRNVINTSFNFKRTSSTNNINHFNDCEHEY